MTRDTYVWFRVCVLKAALGTSIPQGATIRHPLPSNAANMYKCQRLFLRVTTHYAIGVQGSACKRPGRNTRATPIWHYDHRAHFMAFIGVCCVEDTNCEHRSFVRQRRAGSGAQRGRLGQYVKQCHHNYGEHSHNLQADERKLAA